ncbi:Pr6Pr family membrane protein [Saccharothrix sp. NPDC042600]|uniref:Pr6Pr family membrane protein n=1 Tax=Saccharothrix TaxID=2071 RepID=UPI00340BDC0A|nr:Pr6Pr family membrane protein [Saccharothrix mutabilis subsp. capreolus]
MDVRRGWFGFTALVALVGLVVQVVVTAGDTAGRFPDLGPRLFTLFCFFTIQSNVLVLVTNALLAADPDRPSTLFRALRLDGVLAITVTGVVFHTVLKGLRELTGAAAFADFLLHTMSPVLCVIGWLAFGPRGAISARVIGWSVVFPLAWLAFTLVRGAVIDWYPYPFVNVTVLGHGRVLLNCTAVAVLFLALAAGAWWLDRLMSRKQAPVA